MCSDQPFVDYEVIDNAIIEFSKNDYDYLFTIGGPIGVDYCGILDMNYLNKFRYDFQDLDYEHVTTYIYRNADKFQIKKLTYNKYLDHKLCNSDILFINIRLCLDDIKVFVLI